VNLDAQITHPTTIIGHAKRIKEFPQKKRRNANPTRGDRAGWYGELIHIRSLTPHCKCHSKNWRDTLKRIYSDTTNYYCCLIVNYRMGIEGPSKSERVARDVNEAYFNVEERRRAIDELNASDILQKIMDSVTGERRRVRETLSAAERGRDEIVREAKTHLDEIRSEAEQYVTAYEGSYKNE
jgi:hypothetical protein